MRYDGAAWNGISVFSNPSLIGTSSTGSCIYIQSENSEGQASRVFLDFESETSERLSASASVTLGGVPRVTEGIFIISLIRHWEVTARVQKAFFFVFLDLIFFIFLLTWREHAWVSWSVRRGRARSCKYVVRMDCTIAQRPR